MPLLNNPVNGMPSALLLTFVLSLKTFGKSMYVYPKTNSLDSVGLNTCVKLADIESERFGATTEVGYGTCCALRHQSPTGNNCLSRCRLYRT